MTKKEIIERLKSLRNPKNVAGMARFGINPDSTLGIPIPVLRNLAKKIGKNHALAQELWNSGIHEARLLAGFIDNPKDVTEKQMDKWVSDFDSWDICDQVCMNLFDKTPYTYGKAMEWSSNKKEFIKRAGFAIMAVLAVHDKKATDDKFLHFLPVIVREAGDDRNFVKKAVNWALRQIGKRNKALNSVAINCAEEISGIAAKDIDAVSRKARMWVANDAIRELTSEAVQKKLHTK